MPKERSPKEVYEELSEQGAYEEATPDKDEIEKVKRITIEDYEFGQSLRKLREPNWRVIFNIHYDVLRELCDLLILFKRQKTSNHQGLFAFIVLNFKELELDWKFFETIRNIRNFNKYRGTDITEEMWKKVELQMNLYISALKKEIEKRIKRL